MPHVQDEVYVDSIKDPERFWSYHASHLTWAKKPTSALWQGTKKLSSGVTHPTWSWFPDGEINTCYNCVDRHVEAGHGHSTAIIWDSPVDGAKEKYTYAQLKDEVEVLAGVLQEAGLKKGDNVIVYMPMIPQALIGLLAISRLGACHAVVFGGFAPASLAQRIEASQPKLILTASCGIEGTKGPTSYQPLVRGAIERSTWKPDRTVIWQRPRSRWDPIRADLGEMNWNKLVRSAQKRDVRVPCTPVKSSDPVYIIYTSGTTGMPKGVVRETAGHLVGLNLSIRQVFGVHGPGDVMFTASVRTRGWSYPLIEN